MKLALNEGNISSYSITFMLTPMEQYPNNIVSLLPKFIQHWAHR